jgi:leader peptidase (prepilin peptidase)/N-methyltransferase
MAAVLSGGIGGVVALAGGRSRKQTIPFGPFLAAGATVASLFGARVAAWYVGFMH